jgi:hypothetical protein
MGASHHSGHLKGTPGRYQDALLLSAEVRARTLRINGRLCRPT